jgi:hypothetical protein
MVIEEYKKMEQDSTKSLMNNMREFSFPRLVGTKDEKKAIEMVKKKYKELGYDPISEKVPCSYFRANFLPIFGNAIAGILLPITALFYFLHPLLFLIPVILIFVEIMMMSSGSPDFSQPPNHPKKWKIFESENIYATNLPEESESDVHIIFMGHWDSKSTSLTANQRVISYVLLLLSSLLIVFTGVIGLIVYFIPSIDFNNVFQNIMWVISIIGIIPAFILSLNVVGNLSPGACDNATSIANVLECMKYFRNNPIDGVKFTFLLTTAEEIGLTGSFFFINKRKEEKGYSKGNTFVINWDLAGLKGPIISNSAIGIPKKEYADKISPLIPEVAKEQNIDVKNVYLPIGGWTDALCFTFFGFQAITIGGRGETSKVHTAGDTPEIIDPKCLFHSFILGVEIAKKLSKL